ncbi:MAG TPA: S41 family peptidase, partial [Isosphaeraceae bacterium]|nr:S41 family peptidase [Isosphaeraceae bacterium]
MPRRNLIAILGVGLVSVLCWQSTQGDQSKDEVKELYGTFVDAVEQVQSNYVRPVDHKQLLESALRGMLADLDPHSVYFDEDDYKQFEKQFKGSFTGIGVKIEIDARGGRPIVVAPIVNSPAYAAGILAGDQILEVDGTSTEEWTIDKVVEGLTGRPGTEVTLKVMHPGSDQVSEVTVRRAIIELDSVMGDRRKPDDSWDFMLDDDKKIGYIRITSFTENTTEDLEAALNDLQEQDVKGLVLDLRDDPGGFLSAAVEVCDLFVEEGKIVSTKGRNTPEKVYEAEKEGTFSDVPMV